MSRKKKKKKTKDQKTEAAQPELEKSAEIKPSRERLIWLIFVIVLFVGNALLLYGLYNTRSQLSDIDIALIDYRVRLDDALEREKSNKSQKESLDRRLQEMRANLRLAVDLPEERIAELKKAGLDNPISQLKGDLIKHAELIPLESTKGRKYRFRSFDGIKILSPNIVIAGITDGVKEGHIVLDFSVADGNISWNVLKAYEY